MTTPASPFPEVLTSIVLPTCDRESLLPRALASVLAQTASRWELLVVNDGARDLQALQARFPDPRIRWLRSPGHAGVSAARNLGIAAARGEWVAFLDDDDELLPAFLSRLPQFMAERQLDFSWCGIERGEGGPRRCWTVDSLCSQDLRFTLEVAACCGLTARRDLLQRLGGFEPGLRTSEDRELFFRWIGAGCRYAALPEVLVRVHAHNGFRLSDVRHDRDRAVASAQDDEQLLRRYAALLPAQAPVGREYRYHLAGKYFHAGHAEGFWRVFFSLPWLARLNPKLLRRALRVWLFAARRTDP